MSPAKRYDAVALEMRRPGAAATDGRLDSRELVRLAVLAASSHNTQPWRFALRRDAIAILPDYSRRCPVVDPDDAHLFKSLGCAAENLVQAASAQGYDAQASFDSARDEIPIRLERSAAIRASELYSAITKRQCVKKAYDGKPLDSLVLAKLEHAGRGRGVRAILLTSAAEREAVTEYVTRGNWVQLSDPAFRDELVSWIRFHPNEALRKGDGLAGRTAGHPPVPRWLAGLMIAKILTPGSQADTDARNIRSSPLVAVFVSDADDKAAWVEIGRACERFALQATALDVRTAFINQPIEVRAVRSQFEAWLGLDAEHALLALRCGYGPSAPFSLRRPLEQVIQEDFSSPSG